MTILIINDDFPPESHGGAAIVVQRLAEGLAKKHQVTVLTTGRDKSETVKQDGYKLIRWQHSYPLRWRAYRSLYNPPLINRLEKLLKQLKPDVVNCHNIHTYFSYHVLKAAKESGARVVFTGHDVMPFYYGRLNQFLDKDLDGIPDTLDYTFHFLQSARKTMTEFNPVRNPIIRYYLTNYPDKIIPVSDALKKVYKKNGIAKNVNTIYNGIDAKAWQANKKELLKFREQHKIPEDRHTLFFGGRIRRDKGSLVAIQALQYNPKLQLVVAGADRGVIEMKREAKKFGVQKRINFLGNIPNQEMKYVYYATSGTIVPSQCFDSFPNNSVEAMVCGKPVLLSKFAGTLPQVEHREHAYIFNPFNQTQVQASIDFLLNREADEMAIRAKALVTQELAIDKWIKHYLVAFASAEK